MTHKPLFLCSNSTFGFNLSLRRRHIATTPHRLKGSWFLRFQNFSSY